MNVGHFVCLYYCLTVQNQLPISFCTALLCNICNKVFKVTNSPPTQKRIPTSYFTLNNPIKVFFSNKKNTIKT